MPDRTPTRAECGFWQRKMVSEVTLADLERCGECTRCLGRQERTPTRAELLALVEEMDKFAAQMAHHAGSITADAEGLVTLRWRNRLAALLGCTEGE